MTGAETARLLERADAHVRAGRWHQAVEDYREVERDLPDHPGALTGLGRLAEILGQTPQAEGLLERAAAAAPAGSAIWRSLVSVKIALGHFQGALRAAEEVVRLSPADPEALSSVAMLRDRLGDVAGAHEAWTTLCGLAPDDPAAWLGLARAQLRLGEPGSAEKSCDRVLALAPKHLEGAMMRTVLHLEGGFVAAAVMRAAQAVAAHPASARALANLGRALEARGDLAFALEALRRAVVADPWERAAAVALCQTLIRAGRTKEAISVCRTFLEIAGYDGAVMREGVAALRAAGREADAATLEAPGATEVTFVLADPEGFAAHVGEHRAWYPVRRVPLVRRTAMLDVGPLVDGLIAVVRQWTSGMESRGLRAFDRGHPARWRLRVFAERVAEGGIADPPPPRSWAHGIAVLTGPRAGEALLAPSHIALPVEGSPGETFALRVQIRAH